jgi:hypothetical protein
VKERVCERQSVSERESDMSESDIYIHVYILTILEIAVPNILENHHTKATAEIELPN